VTPEWPHDVCVVCSTFSGQARPYRTRENACNLSTRYDLLRGGTGAFQCSSIIQANSTFSSSAPPSPFSPQATCRYLLLRSRTQWTLQRIKIPAASASAIPSSSSSSSPSFSTRRTSNFPGALGALGEAEGLRGYRRWLWLETNRMLRPDDELVKEEEGEDEAAE
jgi:hypothetical protein